MKSKFRLLLCIYFCLGLFNEISAQNVEKNQFKINVLSPGISYEIGLGDKSTLNFELTILPLLGTSLDEEIEWVLFPAVGAEYRYYTNFRRRINLNKNVEGNSGNYFSFLNQVFVTAPIAGNFEYDEPIAYLGSFAYGLQRTYTSGFYFNVAAGPAFFTGDNNPTGSLYLDARVGWVIGKKK